MQKILTLLTRLRCVVKRTGLAIAKISATLGVTDRLFTLFASRLNIPDAKNPHIADEASLCCEADGTCHSENQRDPRRDRPIIHTFCI